MTKIPEKSRKPRIVLALVLFAGVLGCKPQEFEHSNPLDPKNETTRGNPYRLVVKSQDDGILLTWQAPGGEIVCDGYQITRSDGAGPTMSRDIAAEKTKTWLDTTVQDDRKYTYTIACSGADKKGTANDKAVRAFLDRDGDGTRDKEDDDIDGDGKSNNTDTDDDGDGLLDSIETNTGLWVSATDTGTDPLNADSDGDNIEDGDEIAGGTDPNDYADPRFLVTGSSEQIVEDVSTGLSWAQTYETGKDWQGAIDYCNSLTYASQNDWRLPDKDELVALLSTEGAACSTDFPGMPCSWFWSSSSSASSADYAWSVSFGDGYVYYDDKGSAGAARCVRP